MTHLVDSNLPLTSKDKFCIGLACPDLARPKRNFWFDVNRRFESTRCVTLYKGFVLKRNFCFDVNGRFGTT